MNFLQRFLARLKPKKSYATLYEEACAASERAAATKLGRALTELEKPAIWNAGSLMMLEAVDQSIYYATDPAALAAELVDTGRAFEPRLQRMRDEVKVVLEQRHKLSPAEQLALSNVSSASVLLRLAELESKALIRSELARLLPSQANDSATKGHS